MLALQKKRRWSRNNYREDREGRHKTNLGIVLDHQGKFALYIEEVVDVTGRKLDRMMSMQGEESPVLYGASPSF